MDHLIEHLPELLSHTLLDALKLIPFLFLAYLLMEFLEQEWPMDEVRGDWYDCIRQALVFDLYYRENCKSRPSWASNLEHIKSFTRFYCKNGKMSHLEMFSYDFLNENYTCVGVGMYAVEKNGSWYYYWCQTFAVYY